jgi:predicted metal-dependent peptidase
VKKLYTFEDLLAAQSKVWESSVVMPDDDEDADELRKATTDTKAPADPEVRKKLVKDCIELVKGGRYYVIKHAPMIGLTLHKLNTVITFSIPTMAVDDKGNIYINPVFALEKCSKKEAVGVFIHEALHILTLTHQREMGRSHKLWNICTDYVMNYLIINDGFELPKGGCIPAENGDVKFRMPDNSIVTFNIAGKTAEWLYHKLEKTWDEIKSNTQTIPWEPQVGEVVCDPKLGKLGVVTAVVGGNVKVERISLADAKKLLKQQRFMMTDAVKKSETWHKDNITPVQMTGGPPPPPPPPGADPPPIVQTDPPPTIIQGDDDDSPPPIPQDQKGDEGEDGEPGEPSDDDSKPGKGKSGPTTSKEERKKAEDILSGKGDPDEKIEGEGDSPSDGDPTESDGDGELTDGGTESGDGGEPSSEPGDESSSGGDGEPSDSGGGDQGDQGDPQSGQTPKPGQEPSTLPGGKGGAGDDKDFDPNSQQGSDLDKINPVDENGNTTGSLDQHKVDGKKIKVEHGSPHPNAKAPTKEDIRKLVQDAKNSAKEHERQAGQRQRQSASRGMGHGGVRGLVLKYMEPRVDFRTLLKRAFTFTKKVYDMRRPSRRSFAVGSFLPRLKTEEDLADICVAIDTSGSMGQKQMQQIVNEVGRLLKTFPKVSCRLVLWTDRVYFAEEYRKSTSGGVVAAIAKYSESGGTYMSSVANSFKVNGWKTPAATLYFTDGYIESDRVSLIPKTKNFYLIIPGGSTQVVDQLPGQVQLIRFPEDK